MTIDELIREVEDLAKAARENYKWGYLDAAKQKLLIVAAKIVGMLPFPPAQHAPTPGKMQG